jgi:hypothetical protein
MKKRYEVIGLPFSEGFVQLINALLPLIEVESTDTGEG